MRVAKFVKALEVEDVQMLTGDEIRYYDWRHMIRPMCSMDEMMFTPEEIRHRVAPIHHFLRVEPSKKTELYVAYSKEVQELLEMPFDILSRQAREARAAADSADARLMEFKRMGLRERIRFLLSWRPRSA